MKSRMFIVAGLLSFSVLLYPSGVDSVACLKQGLRIRWNRETALVGGGALGLLAMGTWWLYSRSNQKRSTTVAATAQIASTSETASGAEIYVRTERSTEITQHRLDSQASRKPRWEVTLRFRMQGGDIIRIDYSTDDDTILDLKKAVALKFKLEVAKVTIFTLDEKENRFIPLKDDAAKVHTTFPYQGKSTLKLGGVSIDWGEGNGSAVPAQAAAAAAKTLHISTERGKEAVRGFGTVNQIIGVHGKCKFDGETYCNHRIVGLRVNAQGIGTIGVTHCMHDTILDLKNAVARALKVDVARIAIDALDKDKRDGQFSVKDVKDTAKVFDSFPQLIGEVRIAPPVHDLTTIS